MSRLHIHGCGAAALAFATVACGSQPRAVSSGPARTTDCAPADGAAAAQVVRAMYAALRVDDSAAVDRLFTPDFYAFDGGERFTGPGLFAMVKDLHGAGKTVVWEVLEPTTHLACDVAWLTWENRGSIADASRTREITWIESAVLRWSDGGWRMAFFHSTRVPPPAATPVSEPPPLTPF